MMKYAFRPDLMLHRPEFAVHMNAIFCASLNAVSCCQGQEDTILVWSAGLIVAVNVRVKTLKAILTWISHSQPHSTPTILCCQR
jgi:hypothetical protein